MCVYFSAYHVAHFICIRVFISGGGPKKLDAKEISLVAQGGNAKLITLEAHELKSIW